MLLAPATRAPESGLVAAISLSSPAAAAQPAAQTEEVRPRAADNGGGVRWYVSLILLTFGGVAVLISGFLIVQLLRGGGTTVGDAGFEDRIRSFETDIKEEAKAAKSPSAEGESGLTDQSPGTGRATRS
jgi:hypothetical protein